MKLHEDLPDELIEILNSPILDDDAEIVITSADFSGDSIILKFIIKCHEDILQTWQLKVLNVKEEKLSISYTSNINLYSQHFLLLEYKDVQSELYFNGKTRKWNHIQAGIFMSLLELSDKEKIWRYMFAKDEIKQLCNQGYGLFARGPKTVLQIYQHYLTDQGIKAYFVGDIQPSVENQKLMLFELGDSYIIGRNFLFERIS